jgi:hypothetical protein
MPVVLTSYGANRVLVEQRLDVVLELAPPNLAEPSRLQHAEPPLQLVLRLLQLLLGNEGREIRMPEEWRPALA